MTEDIKLSETLNTSLDGRGDLTRVEDDDYRLQRVSLLILNTNFEFKGEVLTRELAEEFRQTVETTIANDEAVDAPVRARLQSINGEEATLDVNIGDRTVEITGP